MCAAAPRDILQGNIKTVLPNLSDLLTCDPALKPADALRFTLRVRARSHAPITQCQRLNRQQRSSPRSLSLHES